MKADSLSRIVAMALECVFLRFRHELLVWQSKCSILDRYARSTTLCDLKMQSTGCDDPLRCCGETASMVGAQCSEPNVRSMGSC